MSVFGLQGPEERGDVKYPLCCLKTESLGILGIIIIIKQMLRERKKDSCLITRPHLNADL